jgi:hypothetical protein
MPLFSENDRHAFEGLSGLHKEELVFSTIMTDFPLLDPTVIRYPKNDKFAQHLAGRFFVAGVSGRFRKSRRKDKDENASLDASISAAMKQTNRLRKEEQGRQDAKRIQILEAKLAEVWPIYRLLNLQQCPLTTIK